MSEFYTHETMLSIWEQELLMERNQALIDAYDPYADFDDDDEFEDYEYQDTDPDHEEHIDYYAEASLYGWEN